EKPRSRTGPITPRTDGGTQSPLLSMLTPDDLRRAIGAQIQKEVSEAKLPASGNTVAAETGTMDPTIVLSVVSTNKRSVSSCYNRSLKGGKGSRGGKLELLVTVQPTGTVSDTQVQSSEFRGS